MTDYYEGPVTVNDVFRILNGQDFTDSRYRCYCEKLHEYHAFRWLDDIQEEHPFLVKSCSKFSQYEEDADASSIQDHPKKYPQKQETQKAKQSMSQKHQ